jgi:hypothetical protein
MRGSIKHLAVVKNSREAREKKGGLFDYAPRAQRGLIPGAAVCYFQMRFSALSYCRRVDLECDKHGIGGGSSHCDDNDAQPDA